MVTVDEARAELRRREAQQELERRQAAAVDTDLPDFPGNITPMQKQIAEKGRTEGGGSFLGIPLGPGKRIIAAGLEPFLETEWGTPEGVAEAFHGPSKSINFLNDILINGAGGSAWSVLQAMGAYQEGVLNALGQVGVEAGIFSPTDAQKFSADTMAALDTAPAALGPIVNQPFTRAGAASRAIGKTPKGPKARMPEKVTQGVADAVEAKATAKAVERISGRKPVTTVQKASVIEKGKSGTAYRIIRNRLAKDVGSKQKADKMLRDWAALPEAQRPDALIDMGGENMKRLSRSVADVSPDKAVKRLTNFIQDQPEQIRGSIARTISNKIGVADDMIDDLKDTRLIQGGEKYDLIADTYIPDDVFQNSVVPLLRTVDGKKAINNAIRIAELDGDEAAVAALKALRKGADADGMTVGTLQNLKEGIDDTIGGLLRGTSPKEKLAGKLIEAKNQMLKDVDAALPAYKDARDFYAGSFEVEEAIKKGREFMKPGKTWNHIKRDLANMNPSEREFYRVGVVDAIDEFIARKVDGADKARLIKSAAMRRKIEALLDDDPASAEEFIDFLQTSSDQFERRRFINPNTGSQTHSRGADAAEMAADVLTGSPGGVARQVTRGAARMAHSTFQKELYETMADAFFVGKPPPPVPEIP